MFVVIGMSHVCRSHVDHAGVRARGVYGTASISAVIGKKTAHASAACSPLMQLVLQDDDYFSCGSGFSLTHMTVYALGMSLHVCFTWLLSSS